jgi:hypothetical protein
MKPLASLPAASPSTVLAVFLRVLTAEEQATFKRKDLEEQGLAQCRQAVTLLRFLRLVTDAGRLEDDVRGARQDPQRLRELLFQRLQSACQEADCWTGEMAALGSRDLSPKRLTELLYALPPIDRQKSRAAKTNMVGCLRTLHQVLLHCDDPGWLEQEYQARQTGDSAEASASAARLQGPRPETGQGRGRGAGSSAAKPRVKSVDVVEAERFHIDFSEEGDKVFVEAWFNPPLSSLSRRQLLSLAKQLEERARALPSGSAR